MSNISNIKEIIHKVSSIAKRYGIHNCYVVGGYPRAVMMGKIKNDVNDLDFASAWPGEATKLGAIVASEITGELPTIFHRTGTINFSYKDMDLEFQGTLSSSDYEPIMRELERYNISINPLTLNIYSRDITINTLIQDLDTKNFYDITGFGIRDIESKIIRTPIDSDVTISTNPMVALRAIRFSLRYNFNIEKTLKSSIYRFSNLLLQKYSSQRLILELLKMIQEDYEGTFEKIKEYNLEEIMKNNKYDIYEILNKVNIREYNGDLEQLIGEDII